MTTTGKAAEELREQVRVRYAEAAAAAGRASTHVDRNDALRVVDDCCGPASCCGGSGDEAAQLDAAFGSGLYGADVHDAIPAEAVRASLGCGNPIAVAALRPGERVLDLGSGGGIDVLLSARRVGGSGFVYGLDMTEEMVELAGANAVRAGATNVEFLQGTIEDVPLADESVDVVISNCVINLSVDKPRVFTEMHRVLVPGGRIGVSDVVAEDHLTPTERAVRGSFVGCIAGALSRAEYLDSLTAAGFVDAEVEFTHEVAPGMHGAIIRATKPTRAGPEVVQA